jgi:hypothetical protein
MLSDPEAVSKVIEAAATPLIDLVRNGATRT